jgi:hypothetical protein
MLESIRQQTLDVLTTLIAHLPNVLGGLLLVLAGWRAGCWRAFYAWSSHV